MLENSCVHFYENKILTHTEDLLWNILLDSLAYFFAKLKKPRADNKLFEITCPKMIKRVCSLYIKEENQTILPLIKWWPLKNILKQFIEGTVGYCLLRSPDLCKGMDD